MADPKRNSTAAKAANSRTEPQAPQELAPALSKAVGSRIRISTNQPKAGTVEGTLFTTSSTANLIALNTTPPPPNPSSSLANQPGDYHIIPISSIKSFQVVSQSGADGSSSPAGTTDVSRVDQKTLKAKEVATVAKLQEREYMRKKGIGKEAQEVYEALAKTLPTRWQDTLMVVNDSVLISAPYRPEDCKAPKDQQHQLDRVRRVIEHERRKLTEKAAKAAAATPTGQRKGG